MTEKRTASRARTIDTKQKQYQRDGEDATTPINAEMQETIGKVAQKLGPIVIKYVQQNGYTMLLDNTGQQQGGLTVLWAPGTTDISQAVVDAYNASSGVAAPAAFGTIGNSSLDRRLPQASRAEAVQVAIPPMFWLQDLAKQLFCGSQNSLEHISERPLEGVPHTA